MPPARCAGERRRRVLGALLWFSIVAPFLGAAVLKGF